jgi:phosphoribosyl 1,2-cyclic phosphodiesterase
MTSMRLVIVGSGSSSSTPKIDCVANKRPCPACVDALRLGHGSKNHRLNPSLLIQVTQPSLSPDGSSVQKTYNVLVDCGKTFREAALKVLVPNSVCSLSAVLLTHHHSDAVMGLDDLREFSLDGPVTVYADDHTMETVAAAFPYLMPAEDSTKPKRWVANILWKPLVNDGSVSEIPFASAAGAPVPSSSLPFVAFTVPHGNDCQCNAFVFPLSADGERVLVYMSDVSAVDAALVSRMQSAVEKLRTFLKRRSADGRVGTEYPIGGSARSAHVDVLILDMLSKIDYFAHLSVSQAIEAAAMIRASRTVFVGMGHGLEYWELSALVHSHQSDGLSLEVGYDGLLI